MLINPPLPRVVFVLAWVAAVSLLAEPIAVSNEPRRQRVSVVGFDLFLVLVFESSEDCVSPPPDVLSVLPDL